MLESDGLGWLQSRILRTYFVTKMGWVFYQEKGVRNDSGGHLWAVFTPHFIERLMERVPVHLDLSSLAAGIPSFFLFPGN